MHRALSQLTVATMLATAALVGCKKEEPSPTPPGTTGGGSPTTGMASPTTKPATTPTTMPAAMSDAMKGGAEVAKSAASTLKDTLGANATAPDATKGAANVDMPKVDAPKAVSDSVKTGAAPDAAKDSEAKLDEIAQLIKDKKYDVADAALKKLEDNKASLPEPVQGKLGDLRKSLDAAKALGGTGVQVPGLNK